MSGYPRGNGSGHVVSDHRDLRSAAEIRNLYNWRRLLKTITFGQLLSLCICGAGVASQALQRHSFNAPMTQNFISYYLLGITYGALMTYRHSTGGATGLWYMLKTRGWKYVIIAVADVQGNYAMVLAYQYTSLTSVQILDSFAIVGVMALSWCLLRVHYRLIHYVGVVTCLVGSIALVFADTESTSSPESASNPALGDVLVLVGATLLSISNVGEEYFVKKFDWVEFVGMIGILGSLISGIQLLIIERHSLESFDWSRNATTTALLMAAYALSLFVLYSVAPHLIRMNSALLFAMSLLTADFYSFLCGLLIFDYKFSALYFVSFVVIVAGLVVYNLKQTGVKRDSSAGQESTVNQEESENGQADGTLN